MIRLVISCTWLILVTALSAYVAATWKSSESEAAVSLSNSPLIQRKKSAPINVPMIANGNVAGYIVAQFVYLTDEIALRDVRVPPEDFIADEAFRELYTSGVDFNHLEKYDVGRLTKVLAERVNHRLEKKKLLRKFSFLNSHIFRSAISQTKYCDAPQTSILFRDSFLGCTSGHICIIILTLLVRYLTN